MTSWQGVVLENIANELKNIREILEKQISYREDGNETERLDFVKKTIETQYPPQHIYYCKKCGWSDTA